MRIFRGLHGFTFLVFRTVIKKGEGQRLPPIFRMPARGDVERDDARGRGRKKGKDDWFWADDDCVRHESFSESFALTW